MSRRLIALNVLIALVVAALGTLLVREVAERRTVPPPSAAARPATTLAPELDPGAVAAVRANEPISAYDVVAARTLFNPSRSESAPVAVAPAPAAPPAPRPILHGLVIDEDRSRAWLEDPASKRTFGYAVGDSVGGGRLERIAADRVVIARPEGPIEVLLRDPSKPRPPVAQAATPGRAPRRAVPGVDPAQPVSPQVPGVATPQAPPQPLPIPPHLLRRPAVATPPGQSEEDD